MSKDRDYNIEEKRANVIRNLKSTESRDKPKEPKNAAESLLTVRTNEQTETQHEELKKVEVPDSDQGNLKSQEETKALVKDFVEVDESPNNSVKPAVSKSRKAGTQNSNTVTRKVGRPKGVPSTKISLNVPDEYLDLVSIAAGIGFRGNMSQYIISLMEKDITENGALYKKIAKMNRK